MYLVGVAYLVLKDMALRFLIKEVARYYLMLRVMYLVLGKILEVWAIRELQFGILPRVRR